MVRLVDLLDEAKSRCKAALVEQGMVMICILVVFLHARNSRIYKLIHDTASHPFDRLVKNTYYKKNISHLLILYDFYLSNKFKKL